MENSIQLDYNDSSFKVYDDIQYRTDGQIYIGVVGPVRTGKSTFIKGFMDNLIIPGIKNENDKKRAIDELPQSGTGKTITTTEPKFIPNEAVKIELAPKQNAYVRLIDCVGFMVDGATGHMENDKERMVKTPWSETEIPFSKAAAIGTKKVICDHSTIGLVVTCDGTITELDRSSYIEAEKRTIEELKKYNKPFVVILNSKKPYSEEAKKIAKEISDEHNVVVVPVNCLQLKKSDISMILDKVLSVFPVKQIEYRLPVWTMMLDNDNSLKVELITTARELLSGIVRMKDVDSVYTYDNNGSDISKIIVDDINIRNGTIKLTIDVDEKCYYKMLSDMTGILIENDYKLIKTIRELSALKSTMDILSESYSNVLATGYAVMTPKKEDIVIDKPELIKHGNKYGIKIKATASSIHLIKAPIESEIAPIVGTMEQANDLIEYINEASENDENGLWETNIFGKSVEQLIGEGIDLKIKKMGDATKEKMQDTLKKIVNESSGGVICIII